jgi:hypothetical protein
MPAEAARNHRLSVSAGASSSEEKTPRNGDPAASRTMEPKKEREPKRKAADVRHARGLENGNSHPLPGQPSGFSETKD